jgi:hypothetical protein
MTKYERKIAENRTLLVVRMFCTAKFSRKKVPTQFDRGVSWLSNGTNRPMRESGFEKLWKEHSELENSNPEGLASKKTNKSSHIRCFWPSRSFSPIQRRTAQFQRRLTDWSSSNWDMMHYWSRKSSISMILWFRSHWSWWLICFWDEKWSAWKSLLEKNGQRQIRNLSCNDGRKLAETPYWDFV